MNSNNKIPFVDLAAQHEVIRNEILSDISDTLARCDFVLGKAVFDFEKDFAAYCGTSHCIGCASGTDAIHLALRVGGINNGDEVIVPAFTFIATALSVTLAGGRPRLVDVSPKTALLDVNRTKEAINKTTKAIVPVHLYGQCAPMNEIMTLANKHGLVVVEDAAQAHGARYGERRAGSIGDFGAFSFYPSKNLGACGDGGAIVLSDQAVSERLRLLCNWGARQKYFHDEPGLNSRLDTIQAAILRRKLQSLDHWNQKRRSLAKLYDAALKNLPGVELTEYDDGSVYHLYVIRHAKRDEALKRLTEAGLGAGIHYPLAVHQQKAYSFLGYKPGDFPIAEDWAARCLSLPMYAEMPESAIDRVRDVLSSF